MRLPSLQTACNFAIPLVLSVLLSGCAFMQLKQENQILQNSTVLIGVVSGELPRGDAPIVVAAYKKRGNSRTIVHYTTLHEPGPYELMVPKGNYRIVAFGDENRNLIYDKGEAVGQYVTAEKISTPGGGVLKELDIVISTLNTGKTDFPIGSAMPPKKCKAFHSTLPGAIADLDDPLFSDEYGAKGLWAPLEFFMEVGGNVYFLEAYDPNKIPVLFVHGAGGSPRNWSRFFQRIDRDKFQPWFFYYPSGASIDSMSYLLLWKLFNLQRKYKFKELYITAHSIGGLVVRSLLVKFGMLSPKITHFISISTPWGGEELAELGVKYSPAVIPAWRDMQRNGAFIESIFQNSMPPSVEHVLFFGHKGNRNPMRPNNDKTVTLASQLDQRAQREAGLIYGFNEDHVSILSSEPVLSQYNAILGAAYAGTKDKTKKPGNGLRVDFSFDAPEGLPWPTPVLLLRPVDKEGSETLIYLNPEDSGQKHGPFPPGNYEISLMPYSFAPEPAAVPVSIRDGEVPRVEFSMKPRGFLAGYVANMGTGDIQAGVFQAPDMEVRIQSITLKGGGITRTLIPTEEEDFSYFEQYVLGTDYAIKGYFGFFGLSACEYELSINAEGYEPYSEMRTVHPGRYENEMVVELVRKGGDPP